MKHTIITMENYMHTPIDGDIAVGRNAAVGGNLSVGGEAVVSGSLRVEGWLDCPNVKGPCRGLYADFESLVRAEPAPRHGWWALVGGTLPADVYVCREGLWSRTGEQLDSSAIKLAVDGWQQRIDAEAEERREGLAQAGQALSAAVEAAEQALAAAIAEQDEARRNGEAALEAAIGRVEGRVGSVEAQAEDVAQQVGAIEHRRSVVPVCGEKAVAEPMIEQSSSLHRHGDAGCRVVLASSTKRPVLEVAGGAAPRYYSSWAGREAWLDGGGQPYEDRLYLDTESGLLLRYAGGSPMECGRDYGPDISRVGEQAQAAAQQGERLEAGQAALGARMIVAEEGLQALCSMDVPGNLLDMNACQLTRLADNGLVISIDADGRGLTVWHSGVGYDSEFAFCFSGMSAAQAYVVKFAIDNFESVAKMTLNSVQGTYFGSNFSLDEHGYYTGSISEGANTTGTFYLSVRIKGGCAMSAGQAVRLRLGSLCLGREYMPKAVIREDALPSSLFEADQPPCQVKPKSKFQVGKRISASQLVGEKVALVSANWRAIVAFDVPQGCTGAWVCGSLDRSYPKYAVADADGRALVVAEPDQASTDSNQGYFINLRGVEGACGLYVEVVPGCDSTTVFYEYGSVEQHICTGARLSASVSQEIAQEAAFTLDGEPVSVVTLTAEQPLLTLSLPQPVSGRSIGVWLRCPDYAALAAAMPHFYAWLANGSTPVGVNELESSQVLQMGEWVLLKVRTADYDADRLSLRGVFSGGGGEAVLQVCTTLLGNHFDRPCMVINFDQSWAATDACGAYDALIAGGVPFTITGAISAAADKLRGAYRSGLLDAGSYGGPTNGTALTGYTSLAENVAALHERIEAQQAQGFGMPTSFGGGGHDVPPLVSRALAMCHYTCVKGGVLGGLNMVAGREGRNLYVSGSADMAMTLGSVFVYFAHGISADPQGETQPAMYYDAAGFFAMLSAVQGHAACGGARLLNMRQWAEAGGA